jgi:neuropeptide Y receptor
MTPNSSLIQEHCDAQFNLGVSPGFEVTTYILYCSVFVLAICGNGIVCYIVCSSARMRSVTNYFIVNLAIGDMLMACLCVPFSFVPTLLLRYWPFGGALCKVINYSQAVSVFVSSYTLVAISIDRYVAIIYPLRPRMTYLQAGPQHMASEPVPIFFPLHSRDEH